MKMVAVVMMMVMTLKNEPSSVNYGQAVAVFSFVLL